MANIRRFRSRGGFTGVEAYLETRGTNKTDLVYKDGTRDHSYEIYYSLEVCERFVRMGAWEELDKDLNPLSTEK